jgi:hypothetical protein
VFRVQTEGEFAKNAPDVRGNVVKLMKYTQIQTSVEKSTGIQAPKMPQLDSNGKISRRLLLKDASKANTYMDSVDTTPPILVLNKDTSLERIDEEDNKYLKEGALSPITL